MWYNFQMAVKVDLVKAFHHPHFSSFPLQQRFDIYPDTIHTGKNNNWAGAGLYIFNFFSFSFFLFH